MYYVVFRYLGNHFQALSQMRIAGFTAVIDALYVGHRGELRYDVTLDNVSASPMERVSGTLTAR